MAYYVFDDNKNKVEAYSKEEFLAFLEQIIEEGSLESIDEHTAFVTKIKGSVDGESHEISFVTEAKFNELKQNDQLIPGAYYFITDDTTAESLEAAISSIISQVESQGELINTLNIKVNRVESNVTPIDYGIHTDGSVYLTVADTGGLFSLKFKWTNSSGNELTEQVLLSIEDLDETIINRVFLEDVTSGMTTSINFANVTYSASAKRIYIAAVINGSGQNLAITSCKRLIKY